MKHILAVEDFVNEQKINERGYNDGFYSILSIGSVNINTGKSKYFNIYDEWTDSTCEIYKDVTRAISGEQSADKFKLVFTAGSTPIKNRDGSEPKVGDKRSFKDDQRGNPLFSGEFVGSCLIKDLKSFASKYGIKSATGYTYK
jgi:hypothetical protein